MTPRENRVIKSNVQDSIVSPEWCRTKAASLVEILQSRADAQYNSMAFTFLDYSEEEQPLAITYGELDRRARSVAALLQARCRSGERALLLYPAGIDYLCAFFGCLYAGVIAVPSYPPINGRLSERLVKVARNCAARVAVVPEKSTDFGGELGEVLRTAELEMLAASGEIRGLDRFYRPTDITRDTVAFLQYTSGSTGSPKGVVVTHGNLIENLAAIQKHLELTPRDHHVTWLPPYHDMGLIGALLGSFFSGFPATMMAPISFIRRPERWLKAIAARHATVSGAPNFAYELCVQKVSDEVLTELDLSCWELAFSGAEPVRASTIDAFCRRFTPCGFRREAFYPCYGLAEATLFVTGSERNRGPTVITIDRDAYARGEIARVAEDAPRALSLVSAGSVAEGHKLLIVDVETNTPRPDGAVGELWVNGPSVAQDYWSRTEDTEDTFYASLPGVHGSFMRTGDLGFVQDSKVYLSGRVKDVIIVRGVNHYPQDLELTVERSHPALRPGCGIAFSLEGDSEELVVIVHEVGKRDQDHAAEIFVTIRAAVLDRHELQLHAIALIEHGSIPKTTSGKLARRPCRAAFEDGALAVCALWTNPMNPSKLGTTLSDNGVEGRAASFTD